MTVAPFPVKAEGTAPLDTAPLANVSLFAELLERIVGRNRNLPGMAVWYGPSGFGKTKSAVYGANRFRAYYIECGSTWTQAKFCRALLTELGLPPTGTISDMVDRAIMTLKTTRRPLIIDEFDHVVARKYVDVVREIHDQSGAAIVLIGEELLPHKLKPFERFHNRVLDWLPAQPCAERDAAILAQMFAPGIALAADLLARIVRDSGGRPRRIAVNLDRVREHCDLNGLTAIDLAGWGNRPLFTGEPPARRA